MSVRWASLILGLSALACHEEAPPQWASLSFAYDAERTAVPADFEEQVAVIDIDATGPVPKVKTISRVRFSMPLKGLPFFDLIPNPEGVYLDDGSENIVGSFKRLEIPASTEYDPIRPYRILDLERELEADSRHSVVIVEEDLELIRESKPNTVDFAFDMRDVATATVICAVPDEKVDCRELWCADENFFLERYLPAPGEWDRFRLELEVRVKSSTTHQIFANGEIRQKSVTEDGLQVWSVAYPPSFNASSFYLHVTAGMHTCSSKKYRVEAHAPRLTDACRAQELAEKSLPDLIETFGPLPDVPLIVEVTDAPHLTAKRCKDGKPKADRPHPRERVAERASWLMSVEMSLAQPTYQVASPYVLARASQQAAMASLRSATDDEEQGRGMEYSGAFQIEVVNEPLIRHELVHMWFGRSIRPARGRDGWIDERMATFFASEHPRSGPRDPCHGLHEQLNRGTPWTRYTRSEVYDDGVTMGAIAYCLEPRAEQPKKFRAFVRDLAAEFRGRYLSTSQFYEFLAKMHPEAMHCIDEFLSSCLSL